MNSVLVVQNPSLFDVMLRVNGIKLFLIAKASPAKYYNNNNFNELKGYAQFPVNEVAVDLWSNTIAVTDLSLYRYSCIKRF